jgi:hypothetical protein
MTIFNIYSGQLGEQQFAEIARSIGSTRDQAIVGSSQIVPILVSAMARISRSEEGARALSDMLDRDHNGSILMQLPALYANPNLGGGDALLSSILGNKRADAIDLVAQESGLDGAATEKLFVMTTSIVMGMIGMKKRQDKIGPAMLAQMLNTFAERHEREESGEPEPEPAGGASDSFFGKITSMAGLGNVTGMLKSGNFEGIGKLVTNLLDKNKDGSVMDDLMGMAGGLLGKK